MKRATNLIPKIICSDNLQLAFYKAQKGKWHKQEVLEYSKCLNENLLVLQKQISSNNIQVGNYHFFTIYDPKERQICAASFPERVLHHALMNICHSIFEKKLIYDTYATRINKGTYKAIEKAKLNTNKNKYFIKFDIRKYFDSINHNLLKQILAKMFKEKQLLSIFNTIINSYNKDTGKGLPIGNLTSQYFANMYLGELDNFVKHKLKLKSYVRYMDDFIVWTNTKAEIAIISSQMEFFLQNKLKLKLKTFFSNKTKHGFTFLSYKLLPNKILLSRKAKRRFKININKYTHLLNNELITQNDFALHTRAFTSFASKAYSKQYRNMIFNNIG